MWLIVDIHYDFEDGGPSLCVAGIRVHRPESSRLTPSFVDERHAMAYGLYFAILDARLHPLRVVDRIYLALLLVFGLPSPLFLYTIGLVFLVPYKLYYNRVEKQQKKKKS